MRCTPLSRWLQVKPDGEEFMKRLQTEGSKVKVEFLISSYDIPEAVRGSYNKEKYRFVIEFKYIGDEPTKAEPQDNYVTFVIGKNSSRLYRIEIGVKALRVEKVELRMKIKDKGKKTLNNLIQKPINRLRQDNYRLTQKALSEIEDELYSPLL
ncbi:hypothetical protein KsCSTR_01290 [Candidatus Kuenenia stuttgartiensis]|nr:hypothetical protein KsCSTR_01290 [Candidatus Kuenenia stuttgartiensis]SOH04538.1 hypothetical protein KSMBR1_2040 [Candidatus Kuenenia stuttgartiensis]